MANDKAVEAQKLAEEQAKKVGQSVQQTKSEAEQLAASTGRRDNPPSSYIFPLSNDLPCSPNFS